MIVQVFDLLWNLQVFKLVVTDLLVECVHPLLLLSFLVDELVIVSLQLARLVVQVIDLFVLLEDKLLHLVIVASVDLNQLPVVHLGFEDVLLCLSDLTIQGVLAINYHSYV